MKVAFVHDWLNGMRGGEKVLEALLDLWPQADIHTLFYEPQNVSEKIRSRNVHVSPLQALPGSRRYYRRLLPLMPWAVNRFKLDGYDLVISISHCAAKAARVPDPARHFCYCLTPMRYIWGQYEAYFGPGRAGLPTRAAMAMLRGPLQGWDERTASRVGRFAGISRSVADRIRDCYDREANVIYPPVDTEFFAPGAESPGDYYLAVSAMAPYKRLDLAIEACTRLNLPLKVVGLGQEEKRLCRIAGPSIQFLGRVSAEELRELYRNCRALVFPAEEDFGIAPVEAQACGRPVIAFRGGGAVETVVESKTGAFFDAQTVEALAEALRSFDPDSCTPGAARQNAERFASDRFLREFTAEIEDFLE